MEFFGALFIITAILICANIAREKEKKKMRFYMWANVLLAAFFFAGGIAVI